MRTARVADPGAIIPNRAAGYQKAGKSWVNEAFVSKAFSELGDGMLMASANDLLAWQETLMAGRVLSATSWLQMWTPSKPSEGRYGFGFGVERSGPKPRLTHTGGWIGTNTFLLSDLQTDSCIIVLINTDESPMTALIKGAIERLAKSK
jgi:CubicO group peptidase (beta-lactamase class C family)